MATQVPKVSVSSRSEHFTPQELVFDFENAAPETKAAPRSRPASRPLLPATLREKLSRLLRA